MESRIERIKRDYSGTSLLVKPLAEVRQELWLLFQARTLLRYIEPSLLVSQRNVLVRRIANGESALDALARERRRYTKEAYAQARAEIRAHYRIREARMSLRVLDY
ncbi:MAG: hypothetical protein ACK4Q5_16605, partial [Saprospiraceae bacterium]